MVLLGLLALVGRSWVGQADAPGPTEAADALDESEGERLVLELFAGRRSGEMVLVEGVIDGVLSDDNDGSRHQRFIMRLDSGHTLLVAHNIDVAPRVPLGTGDLVRVRGEYEWNDRGGVLHWTHRDPGGQRPGGWIDWAGDRYR
ncbi:MAG: DUF3465 domain-containing protein [Gemmatimonadota bacterium]|nr:DUF3465 domain-containing protein [Gemmatimonadota bacterium]